MDDCYEVVFCIWRGCDIILIMKFESVVLNQEGQKLPEQLVLEQESRLNTEIEASPALVRKMAPGWGKFITVSILSLVASGCERETNSSAKGKESPRNGNNTSVNWDEVPYQKEEIIHKNFSEIKEWLDFSVEERGGNYEVNVDGPTYILTADDMNKLYKFNQEQKQIFTQRENLNDKFMQDKLEELKGRKPTPHKLIEGSIPDKGLAEHHEKIYKTNLVKWEAEVKALEENKPGPKITFKMIMEDEIKRLGDRQ